MCQARHPPMDSAGLKGSVHRIGFQKLKNRFRIVFACPRSNDANTKTELLTIQACNLDTGKIE